MLEKKDKKKGLRVRKVKRKVGRNWRRIYSILFYSIIEEPYMIVALPLHTVLPPGADVMIPLYHVLRWFSSRWHQGREYSMIYRRLGFLAVVSFSSLPTPSTSLPSVSSTGDTKEDWERETTCWRERRKGVGEKPNHTIARKSGSL